MKIPRKQDELIRISLRVPPEIHAELLAAAKYNGRFLNDEVLERVKAKPVLDRLDALLRENAEMKAMIKEMHDLASDK